MAEPAAGGGVSHRLSGRHDGEDAGQRTRAEPGDLCGAGGGSRGAKGSPGAMGGAAGGSEILAASVDRAEEPWGEGYLHRLRGWAERISRGHRSAVSADRGQLCIVHLVRASLNYVPWKHRKLVAADLRQVYQAATAEEARQH